MRIVDGSFPRVLPGLAFAFHPDFARRLEAATFRACGGVLIARIPPGALKLGASHEGSAPAARPAPLCPQTGSLLGKLKPRRGFWWADGLRTVPPDALQQLLVLGPAGPCHCPARSKRPRCSKRGQKGDKSHLCLPTARFTPKFPVFSLQLGETLQTHQFHATQSCAESIETEPSRATSSTQTLIHGADAALGAQKSSRVHGGDGGKCKFSPRKTCFLQTCRLHQRRRRVHCALPSPLLAKYLFNEGIPTAPTAGSTAPGGTHKRGEAPGDGWEPGLTVGLAPGLSPGVPTSPPAPARGASIAACSAATLIRCRFLLPINSPSGSEPSRGAAEIKWLVKRQAGAGKHKREKFCLIILTPAKYGPQNTRDRICLKRQPKETASLPKRAPPGRQKIHEFVLPAPNPPLGKGNK